MAYITKKDIDFFRSEYQRKGFGTVDAISHVFGWASHEKFYAQMESWCAFIDGVFPDYFPFNMVQGFLQSVVTSVYNSQAELHYDKGVDCGRQLVAKAEEIVNWAQNKINSAISDANNYIQTNMINPINDYINNNIKPALKDAQSNINAIQNKINEFANNISAMGNQVNGFQGTLDNFNDKINSFNSQLNDLLGRANGFDSKLADFNSTLNGLQSQATSLDSALKDAQNRLTQYKALIDALDGRVSSLEGKKPTPTTEPAPSGLLSILSQKVI